MSRDASLLQTISAACGRNTLDPEAARVLTTTSAVAEHDGHPVGFISRSHHRITDLAVLPAFQGRGIGGALLTLAEIGMTDDGVFEAVVEGPISAQAEAFFLTQGWKRSDRSRGEPGPRLTKAIDEAAEG